MTMTFSDQVALARQDGRVTDDLAGGKPARPKRRTFTAAYKARILAAYDALPEGSAERGALLRTERLYHSHIEHWREQAAKGTLPASTGKTHRDADSEELARLRAENKKLKADSTRQEVRADKLAGELDRTRTALEIAGKAFALLQDISSSADSDEK
jgi:transposase